MSRYTFPSSYSRRRKKKRLPMIMMGCFVAGIVAAGIKLMLFPGASIEISPPQFSQPTFAKSYDFITKIKSSKVKDAPPLFVSSKEKKQSSSNPSEEGDDVIMPTFLSPYDFRYMNPKKKNIVAVTFPEGKGQVRRKSLFATSGTTYEYRVKVPDGAMLRFYYGLISQEKGIHFQAEVGMSNRSAEVVFSSSIVPGDVIGEPTSFFAKVSHFFSQKNQPIDGHWWPVEVDLSAWAGQDVYIRLKSLPLESKKIPQSHLERPYAFWGNPALWTTAVSQKALSKNVFMFVFESLRYDSIRGRKYTVPKTLQQFVLEGIHFQKTYSNAVLPMEGLRSLFTSHVQWVPEALLPKRVRRRHQKKKAIPLPGHLNQKKYQTSYIGLWKDADPVVDWGFDEAYQVFQTKKGPLTFSQAAQDWLKKNNGLRPCLAVFYFPRFNNPHLSLRYWPFFNGPPWRFWLSTARLLSWLPKNHARWRYDAEVSYLDAAMTPLFSLMENLDLWSSGVSTLVSLSGHSFRSEPATHGRTGRTFWYRPSLGEALREEEVRVQWAVRHPSITSGQTFFDPVQILDVAPTVLSLIDESIPPSYEGQICPTQPGIRSSWSMSPRILIHGLQSKALVLDGHYKYIRRVSPSHRSAASLTHSRLPREEILDLWTDPQERHNLVRHQRNLLARVRRAMRESYPDRAEVGLQFWDLGDRPLQGVITSVAGDLWNVQSDFPLYRRGSREIRFDVKASSGTVVFETWPPYATYIVRLKYRGRDFFPHEARVSKLGLPLFERSIDQWIDRNKFPWMEGRASPRSDDPGPSFYFGREPVLLDSAQGNMP